MQYQKSYKSVRPPLIPAEDETEKLNEGFFGSLGRLFLYTGSTVAEIFGGLFMGFRKKPLLHHQFEQQYNHPSQRINTWPMQDSYVIPDEDEPPSLETRTPTAKRTYQFMAKDMEKNHHFKQNRALSSGWEGNFYQQQQQHMHLQQMQQKQQHHQRHYSSTPQTCYEKSCESNEIVFGAVQEQDGQSEVVVIKSVDYADPIYNHYNIRPRHNYLGYSNVY